MSNKKKRFKSFEELAASRGMNISSPKNNHDEENWVRIWCVRFSQEKGFGFFKSKKHKKQIFVNKEILLINKIDTKLLNEQAIFDATVIKTEKGLQAKNLRYVAFRVPSDTSHLLEDEESDNLNLKYFKYGKFGGNKFDFPKNIATVASKLFNKIPFEKFLNSYLLSLQQLPLQIKVLPSFKPDWRLVVGLGTDTVYETGITLHHIYGFPYIPGQAVKGALRSYIINEFFDKEEGDKKNGALSDPLFCDIFGCPQKSYYKEARAGLVWFFDAYPSSTPVLEVDVMNPHYSEYYSGKGDLPPADYYNPVPIFFLTVGKDTQFKFIIGIQNKYKNKTLNEYSSTSKLAQAILNRDFNLELNCNLLEFTSKLLLIALQEHGIGAKTAVGYGYFNKV